MQLYILYFEIIDFDVKQSWTELCWIPPRLVTTRRRHKSELSTSVSYRPAMAELMLALIELPLLWDEKIGKIGLRRLINCHLLTQAPGTDLPGNGDFGRTELRNWTQRFVQLIDPIFLRYRYSIFYWLKISGRWNGAYTEREREREVGSQLYCDVVLCMCIWLLSIVCQFEMKQSPLATLEQLLCSSTLVIPRLTLSTSRLDLKRNLCSVESHYLEWFSIFLSTFSLTDLRRDCMGPPCRSMSS